MLFDGQRLAAELQALPESAWMPHPQGFPGNDAVPLVSAGGGRNDDFEGAMGPTEYLEACPYVMDVMRALGGVWGRSRFMGLAAGAEVRQHFDVHYYWRTHLRIHIPVVTNPDVRFNCAGESVHMAPGECWVFDSFAPHSVQNDGSGKRVHLVLDSVGSESLWDLVQAAYDGVAPAPEPLLPSGGGRKGEPLLFEQFNAPAIMSPWEIRQHLDYIVDHAVADTQLDSVLRRFDRFITAWHAAWARFGTSDAGAPTYRELLDQVRADLRGLRASELRLRTGAEFMRVAEALIFWNAVRRSDVGMAGGDPQEPLQRSIPAPAISRSKIERPIFIVSTPRSGSTLLFETLAKAPGLYSPGGESHGLIEGLPALSVQAHDWESNRLIAADATPEAVEQLAETFYRSLRDREAKPPKGAVRMLEKTPKNALRVPFFDSAWPDSRFVFLYRDPRQTIASMIEAWMSGRFRTYPGLPGWTGRPWSLLLVPGWRSLVGKPLQEVVAHQWKATMERLIEDLGRLPRDRVRVVHYSSVVDSPGATIDALARSLDLEWDQQLGDQLPLSRTTVSRPSPDKWRQIEPVIDSIWPVIADTDSKARAFADSLRDAAVIQ